MAWWDCGYQVCMRVRVGQCDVMRHGGLVGQIAGVANRTTIADGNTWNHEHIATLGRALTSPEKDAHEIVRHLADYVLIWTGGGGDDLAKSPHMARIGNSVYPDICPGDPTCRKFGFLNQEMAPSPMMAASLLYRLHSGGVREGVSVDPRRFKEAFTSKCARRAAPMCMPRVARQLDICMSPCAPIGHMHIPMRAGTARCASGK